MINQFKVPSSRSRKVVFTFVFKGLPRRTRGRMHDHCHSIAIVISPWDWVLTICSLCVVPCSTSWGAGGTSSHCSLKHSRAASRSESSDGAHIFSPSFTLLPLLHWFFPNSGDLHVYLLETLPEYTHQSVCSNWVMDSTHLFYSATWVRVCKSVHWLTEYFGGAFLGSSAGPEPERFFGWSHVWHHR